MSELMQYFIGFAAFAALASITVNKMAENESWLEIVGAVIWIGWTIYYLVMCAMIVFNEGV